MSVDDGSRTIAGRYRLSGELGRGGMGAVWRAWDAALEREVAVKEVLLPPSLPDAQRAETRQRVLREARAAARIDHPAVVTVHDVFDHGGPPGWSWSCSAAGRWRSCCARRGRCRPCGPPASPGGCWRGCTRRAWCTGTSSPA